MRRRDLETDVTTTTRTMSEDLTRAGMNVVRVCVFHMKSHVASRQPGLCHEAYGIMVAECFAFQADIMADDANMSGYRYSGSRQTSSSSSSSSIKHSCWQDMVRYFIRAHNDGMHQDPYCRVIPRFVSSNPLSSLRWWEDTFGAEYDQRRPVNWDTVPTLDCIVCCILECGHSIPMDRWVNMQAGLEYKVSVSGWLLHSSKDDYLFSPTDKDSHAPLLVHLNPLHFTPADLRATLRPESKMDRNTRRKERQKINKAQAAGATSGTTGTTSTAPPPTRGTTASAAAPPRKAPGRTSSAAPKPVEQQHL